MAGRHDKAGDDPSPGLMRTGPIAVRGLSRGVRGALRPGKESRHRAAEEQSELAAPGLVDEGDVAGDSEAGDSEAGDLREAAEVDERETDAAEHRAPEDVEDADVTDQDPDAAARRDAEPAEPAQQERQAAGAADSLVSDDDPFAAAAVPETDRDENVPLSQRFGREAIGVAVLVVLAIVCAGLITAVVFKTRNDAALAAREAAAYTPPPLTSSSSSSDASSIAIIGDESASRAASGVSAKERWPALLGSALGVDVTVHAASGAGYSTEASGTTFVEEAARIPSGTRYVVFVGGAADAGTSALTVAKAATQAYAAATEQAPDATILVVGPLFQPSSPSASDLTALRSTLRSASRIAGVQWVDPIKSKWVPSADATSDLNAAREKAIAARALEALRSIDD